MRFNEYFSRFKPGGGPQIELGTDAAPVDATDLGDDNVCTIRWQHDFNLEATAYVVATATAPAGSAPVAGTVYVYDKHTQTWMKASEGVVRPGETAYFDIPMVVPDVKSPFEVTFAFVPGTIAGEAYPAGEYVFGIGLSYRTGQVSIATQKTVPDTLYPNETAKLHISPAGYLYVTLGSTLVPVTAYGPAPQDSPVTGNPVEISLEALARTDGVALANPVSADGDVIRPRGSWYGVSYTSIVSDNGAGRLLVQHNDVWGAGAWGATILAVRNDNAASDMTAASGRLSPIATDAKGSVWVRFPPGVEEQPIPIDLSIPTANWEAGGYLGAGVSVHGHTRVTLLLAVTKNDSVDVEVRCVGMRALGGTEYDLPIMKPDTSVPGSFVVYSESEVIRVATPNATTFRAYTWAVDNNLPFVRFQVRALSITGASQGVVVAADTWVLKGLGN